mmetsp:Transcript_15602/g.34082  ORF Transcript_15602/g.34082 Transcript_15602/m.34082 type:complete len:1190 (-) Transcript_15602:37-3606(-)|eukprot:CAMPEP_0168788034 /NCGR_PEP_ID=MMETSP0725-20121227/12115_1 /TAXON_ID=265536 /ORGANISM="Amphiprora sp., Strain CCMP467" /LENGTH=1189 /DNA_ID=CAMNT_0008838273 /DNA_START=45 /DNA_END=3614 /DNA_ORIENTATION=-
MSSTGSSSTGTFVPDGPSWNLNDPTKIFGRDKELQLLSELMERQQESSRSPTKQNNTTEAEAATTERPRHTTAVLHGNAGSGKSTLVRSLQRNDSAVSNDWILCTGKFEQHRSHEPFSALIEAVNELVGVWIHHNSMAQVCQMSNLRGLLEEDCEFLQALFPRMYQAIVSHSVCLSTLGANHHRQSISLAHRHRSSFTLKQDLTTVDRLHSSFKRLLNFLSDTPAAANHPVVLFLDDVHWADAASFKVIETLASCDQMNPSLFLIISYRDEEVTEPDHPLNQHMEAIQNAIAKHETRGDEVTVMPKLVDIPVTDLTVESVNSLLSSLVQKEEDETLPLAQVAHKKTHGNPFFVAQFFLMLRQQQFLRYSYGSYGWEWGNVEQLASMAHVTDNVADLISHTIQTQLPPNARVALQVASCLGKHIPCNVLCRWFANYYSEETDGTICSMTMRQIHIEGLKKILDSAVQLGILIQADMVYMWAHDKLQSVTYDLIPPEKRPQFHIEMGRLLWAMSKEEEEAEEWMIFMAAEQMNRYSAYQDKEGSEPLGAEVAELCLEAAQLSLSKSALYPAYDMLMASMKHLQIKEYWKDHYDLSLRLYSTVAELSIQLGKKEDAMSACKQVLENATSHLDKFRVQMVELKSISSGQDRNYKAAYDRSVEILKDYGIKTPTRFISGQMTMECRKLRRLFPGYKLDGVLEMSPMQDGAIERNIMKLLLQLAMYGLQSQTVNRNNVWYAATRVITLTAEKGVCEESAMGIGMLAGAVRMEGHYKEANEYAEVALKLIERFPQNVGSVHASVIGMIAGGVYSSTKPVNESLELWLESHHVALRTGVTEKAGGSIQAYAFTYLAVGLPLSPLKADLVEYEKEARQFGLPPTLMAMFSIFRQFIVNLQQRGLDDPTIMTGEIMDQEKLLQRFSGNGLRMTKRDLNTFRLVLANIYGDLDTMETLVGDLEQFIDGDHFVVRSGLRLLAIGLSAFRLNRVNGKRKLRQLAKRIKKKIQGQLKLGNVNMLPFFQMFEAEESPSKERYDNAIRSCARLGLIHFEAYMCEQAAVWFLEEQNDPDWAEFYMEQAFALYGDWGATGKSQQLKEKYPRLLRSASLRERANAALKGRTRYSSSHTDILAEFDWDRLSTSTISKSTGSSASSLVGKDVELAPTESSSDSGSNDDSLRGSGTMMGSRIMAMFGSPLS